MAPSLMPCAIASVSSLIISPACRATSVAPRITEVNIKDSAGDHAHPGGQDVAPKAHARQAEGVMGPLTSVPPHDDPQPAVQPKQWLAVEIRRSASLSGSKSRMWVGAP
jgi:hypothetical protein